MTVIIIIVFVLLLIAEEINFRKISKEADEKYMNDYLERKNKAKE